MSCYCRKPSCPRCNLKVLKSPVPVPHNRCNCQACLQGNLTMYLGDAKENGPKYRDWKKVPKEFNPPMEFDIKKMEQAGRLILEALGEDPERDGLKDTPKRFAKYYSEIMNGNFLSPSDYVTEFENENSYDGPVIIKDLPFYTLCMHHLAPFIGKWAVAYEPKDKILGLSKVVRIARVYQKRPQVQEILTKQISDTMNRLLEPEWLVVRMEAEHFCMSTRGVRTPGSKTITRHGHGDWPKGVFSE